MLRTRGSKVGQQQLTKFLEFIDQVCSCSPKKVSHLKDAVFHSLGGSPAANTM